VQASAISTALAAENAHVLTVIEAISGEAGCCTVRWLYKGLVSPMPLKLV